MPSFLHTLVLGSVLLLASACLNVTPPGTRFASEPPGARVHVDGRDSGWVTPCQIALDPESRHQVTIALEGYEPRAIELVPELRRGIVSWRQGANAARSTVSFPILLPMGDFLFPLRQSEALAPGSVFVRLRAASDP